MVGFATLVPCYESSLSSFGWSLYSFYSAAIQSTCSPHSAWRSCMCVQGFIQDFLWGECFWNSEIDIKHTLLGGSGDMPPRKCLTNHRPEIESGGFWQQADCSQVPITCVQNHCNSLFLQLCHYFFLKTLGGGGGGEIPGPPPSV